MKVIVIIIFVFLILGISVNVSFAEESIYLQPTDDAFIIFNLLDPQDLQGLKKMTKGDTEFISLTFAPERTEPYVSSVPFLKFDLKDFESESIDSAVFTIHVANKGFRYDAPSISVYLTSHSNWNESELNYNNAPALKNRIGETTIKNIGEYSWDITKAAKQFAGKELSISLSFTERENIRVVDGLFTSKESETNQPTLKLMGNFDKNIIHQLELESQILELEQELKEKQNILDNIKQLENTELNVVDTATTYQNYQILNLKPIDDAFVVNNLSDPDNIEGYQTFNTGNLDFLKSWYAWNVTEHKEQILTASYLKFDLNDIKYDKVNSAQLKLTPQFIKTSFDNLPVLNLVQVDSNNWNESEINFTNKPSHDEKTSITNTIISNLDNELKLYNWDVTDLVKQNSGSELSVMLSNGNIYENSEEIVSFYSKETKDKNNTPVLVIEYLLDDTTNDGGGCLIATATYGTELAPQVQLLRELRDNTLLNTESGKSFMNLFNNVYYSFSPQIADLERENPLFKELTKLAITPLISSLLILNYVDIDSEFEMLGYGISIITLNFTIYFVAPAIVLYQLNSRINSKQ